MPPGSTAVSAVGESNMIEEASGAGGGCGTARELRVAMDETVTWAPLAFFGERRVLHDGGCVSRRDGLGSLPAPCARRNRVCAFLPPSPAQRDLITGGGTATSTGGKRALALRRQSTRRTRARQARPLDAALP